MPSSPAPSAIPAPAPSAGHPLPCEPETGATRSPGRRARGQRSLRQSPHRVAETCLKGETRGSGTDYHRSEAVSWGHCGWQAGTSPGPCPQGSATLSGNLPPARHTRALLRWRRALPGPTSTCARGQGAPIARLPWACPLVAPFLRPHQELTDQSPGEAPSEARSWGDAGTGSLALGGGLNVLEVLGSPETSSSPEKPAGQGRSRPGTRPSSVSPTSCPALGGHGVHLAACPFTRLRSAKA